MHDLAQEIGKRVKAARDKTDLTQEDVARALGIGRAGYSNIENGRSLLTLEHLVKLPEIFNEPVTYFLGADEAQQLSEVSTNGLVDLYAEYKSHVKAITEHIDHAASGFSRKLTQLSPENQRRVFEMVDTLYLQEIGQAISSLPQVERNKILSMLRKQGQ